MAAPLKGDQLIRAHTHVVRHRHRRGLEIDEVKRVLQLFQSLFERRIEILAAREGIFALHSLSDSCWSDGFIRAGKVAFLHVCEFCLSPSNKRIHDRAVSAANAADMVIIENVWVFICQAAPALSETIIIAAYTRRD